MLTVGSCFSGIGGLELGLEWTGGFKTKWQIELDPYASKVLAKHWPNVERFTDITTVINPPTVDVICGGFPCQDVSVAGARAGLKGKRSTLWGEMYRLVCETRPRWIVAENVPGLLSSDDGRFFGNILRDLASAGYDAEWGVLSAAGVGAPHLRRRVFILGHTKYFGRHSSQNRQGHREGTYRNQEGEKEPGQPAGSSRPREGDVENARRQHGKGAAIQGEFGKQNPQGDAPEPQRPAQRMPEGAFANAKGFRTQGRLRKSYGSPITRSNGDTQSLADAAQHTGRLSDRNGQKDVPHTKSETKGGLPERTETPFSKPGISGEVCDPAGQGLSHGAASAVRGSRSLTEFERPDWWAIEPNVGRVAHGVPSRVDRLKCLGNAVVPQVAQKIGEMILSYEN